MNAKVRDSLETTLRGWDLYERKRGTPVIDFDLYPTQSDVEETDRVTALSQLLALQGSTDDPHLTSRLRADIAYLRAILGERLPLADFVEHTQGSGTLGWPAQYVTERGDMARDALASFGIPWGPETLEKLVELEGPLSIDSAKDAMWDAIREYEPGLRQLVNSDVDLNISIEVTDVDAYWKYWADGAGNNIRLRLNMRHAKFTKVTARHFALHEALGHGLQAASLAARCAKHDVPWVRFLSVTCPQQVAAEGIAQALPLLVAPDDIQLVARTRLDHYLKLVHSELHIAINDGASVEACIEHAQKRVPFWSLEHVGDLLTDRASNPMLRSYLWAYPAGIDWFIRLAEEQPPTVGKILHDLYTLPLTPADLATYWPNGPVIGGPGNPIRLRHTPVS